MSTTDRLRLACTALAAALAIVCVAWELWLAPLRPGGSMLALKALPIGIAVPAFRRGRVRTYQWWSMLILLYAGEGLVRGVSDPTSAGRLLGWIETGLAAAIYGAILLYVRAARTVPGR